MMMSSRLGVVVASVAVALGVGACASGTGTPDLHLPAAPRELTPDQQVRQALNRLTFGPRAGDVEQVKKMGLDNWIVRQLTPEKIDDSQAEAFLAGYRTQQASVKELADSFPPLDIVLRQMRRERGLPDTATIMMSSDDSARFKAMNDRGNRIAQEIPSAKLARAVVSERQLLEVMTDFWENHFSVWSAKMPTRFSLAEYDREVIRPHALGKFRELLGAVAKSPEMLYYLDNWQSVTDSTHLTLREHENLAKAKTAADSNRIRANARRRRAGLNENYARELMELHTLGVDGGYTQRDIIEVARALTGWTIRDPRLGGGYYFRPEVHDADVKHVLGTTLPAGRGEQDGEDVLDIVAHHPSTARYIATKLVRRFVSDTPPAALVERAAATFRKTDGDIRQVLLTIVGSPEFFSRAAYHSKVKSPFEFVASALRIMNAAPDSTPRTAGFIGRLGQPTFGHQAPNGWPETGDAWMNTGAILDRINFGVNLARGGVPGATAARWPLAQTLAKLPLEQQVNGVVDAILAGDASRETREILLTGQNPLAASARGGMRDTTATAMMASAPAPVPPARITLADLVGLALGSPEFQRR